jgi:thioredoxin-like negative regulator of GroEL
MTSFVFAAALCASSFVGNASNTTTYAEAHRITAKTGKPMIIMVGTDWCGPCQQMKKSILPEVRKHGMFKDVSFAMVNADQQQDLARKLTGGGPIPPLVMYRKTNDGWKRSKLVGGQSVKKVESFINKGLSLDRADKKAVKTSPVKNVKTTTKSNDKTVDNKQVASNNS